MNKDTKQIKIDATDKIWGRVASQVSLILQNKISNDYEKNMVGNVLVTVENLSKIKFTGKKLKQKIYYTHSGFIGHQKETTLEFKLKKNPEKAFKDSVRGMLPKNSLRDKRLKHLIIKL